MQITRVFAVLAHFKCSWKHLKLRRRGLSETFSQSDSSTGTSPSVRCGLHKMLSFRRHVSWSCSQSKCCACYRRASVRKKHRLRTAGIPTGAAASVGGETVGAVTERGPRWESRVEMCHDYSIHQLSKNRSGSLFFMLISWGNNNIFIWFG